MARTQWRQQGKATLDLRHRNKESEISGKHRNSLIPTLHKVYGQSFAAGYPETEKLREVVVKLNENLYAAALGPDDTRHPDLVVAT